MRVSRDKRKTIERRLNSGDVRDIDRILKQLRYGLFRVKKTLTTDPYFLKGEEMNGLDDMKVDICFKGEMDESWSYVQKRISAGCGML